MEQERERGITITSAATTCFWKGMDKQLSRAPHQHHRHAGPRRLHDRSRALDARARRRVHGLSTRSAACSRNRKPCGGRPTSTRCRGSRSSTRWTARAPNFFKVYDQMKSRLKANPVPIQIPIGAEEKFEGVVDLVRMKAIYWDEASQGMKYEMRDDPGRARRARPRNGARRWSRAPPRPTKS